MKTLAKILPHAGIILSGLMVVLFIVDRFNPAMAFIDNDGTKALILALSATSLVAAQRRATVQVRGRF